MNFCFHQLKSVIQEEFDAVLDHYPSDLSFVSKAVPLGADAYTRKLQLVTAAAKNCPIHIFDHYPFAFEIDCGQIRNYCHDGIGRLCKEYSGVDFSSLTTLRAWLTEKNLGSFNDYTDFLHRTLDHDKLLSMGFKGVYEECQRYNLEETDPAKKAYRELVMQLCLLVKEVGERFRALAEEKVLSCLDEDARYNLTRMARSANVPWEPASTMFEALSAILRTALFISGFDGVEMNCMGMIDRLIFPYYQKDLTEGILSDEEAYFLLQCFLFKTDCHAHFNEERTTYDNGVSIMIGGCDPKGQPVYNRITQLVLKAYMEHPYINPKLNARASSNSPRAYLEDLTALMRTGHNNLVIENDAYIIPMFLRMGLSPEDARSYIGNGCQEVICPNQLHSRAFTYLNLPKVLLDTLHEVSEDGRIPGSYQILYNKFLERLRGLILRITDTFAPYEKIQDQINPEPMLSAFTEDCMAKGQDITQGGARYNHKTLSLVGFGTLCDSLLALQQAYEEHRTLDLIEATLAGFANNESLRLTLQQSKNRFGHSESADLFAGRLAHDLAEVSRGIYNPHGIEWATSLFTYYQFDGFGSRTGATPDGRLANTSFSRQMNMAVLPELTTAACSMSMLSEADFHDVGMFDLALPLMTSDSEAFWKALPDYIKTCLELKIPVLQTNITDPQMLVEERNHHGIHPDLVVRVCGYSAIFSQLSVSMQDEIIARTQEHSLVS